MVAFDYDRFRENRDGYAESIVAERERVARQIRRDDPSLTSLTIGINHHFPPQFLADPIVPWKTGTRSEDDGKIELWRAFGEDVAKNTHISQLNVRDLRLGDNSFPGCPPVGICLAAFFSGVDGNRSIRELSLDCHFLGVSCYNAMGYFFKSSGKIEKLTLGDVEDMRCSYLRTMAPAIAGFDSLLDFNTGYNFSFRGMETEFQLIMQALSGHANLRKLGACQTVGLGCSHCVALATSLLGPTSKLEELNLRMNEIGDKGIRHLANALSNNTLKELNLESTHNVTEKKLVLDDNVLCDESVISLGRFLNADSMLTTLDLSHNSDVSAVLEDLDLSSNTMNDNALEALAQALARNPALKRIGLCGIEGVTSSGWTAFMRALTAGTFALESLDLCYNNELNDEALLLLADGLASNPQKPKYLDLRGIDERHLDLPGSERITNSGWTTFFQRLAPALSDARCSLETLFLDENSIDDTAAEALASSMASNSSLKDVHLDENEDITSRVSSFPSSSSSFFFFHAPHGTKQQHPPTLRNDSDTDECPKSCSFVLDVSTFRVTVLLHCEPSVYVSMVVVWMTREPSSRTSSFEVDVVFTTLASGSAMLMRVRYLCLCTASKRPRSCSCRIRGCASRTGLLLLFDVRELAKDILGRRALLLSPSHAR
ncbi:hypothetical protein ACHAXT_002794 [Thalassiosira profunda]